MKKTCLYRIVMLLISTGAFAQSAKVTVVIVNTPYFEGYTTLSNQTAKYDPAKKGVNYLLLNTNHKSATCTFNLAEPTFITLSLSYALAKSTITDKYFSYNLFLTPGDELTVKIDPTKKTNNIAVTGTGSNNNQPEIFALTEMDTEPFKGDKTPDRIIAAINRQNSINKKILTNYVKKYKPSTAFIKNAQLNMVYLGPETFYEFNHNNNFGRSELYLRKWQKVQDSLFASVVVNGSDRKTSGRKGDLPNISIANNDKAKATGLNSDEALTSYNYPKLIFWFCLREKERLWMEEQDHPTSFYKQWYHTAPNKGKASFRDERSSLLVEKLINKYFTGKAAEFAYSNLLKYNLYSSNYQNIPLIFDHFRQKFPDSKYIAEFTAPVNEIAKKQSSQLNDKMVFVANNGTKLNTLKEVLALTKGKTVLVDMWGIWCSPCREEIEKNAVALETYFKGKKVDFLYIDSHDVNNESGWKKLIAYYHMEGMHILANDKLDKDIMKKTGGQGYPTYFIIKKDGSYGLTKTQYPINRQAMINELLAASK